MTVLTFEEVLDALDYALKIEVPNLNEDRDPFTKQMPTFQIQDSWGGHTDLPLGLDLSEVA